MLAIGVQQSLDLNCCIIISGCQCGEKGRLSKGGSLGAVTTVRGHQVHPMVFEQLGQLIL